jgi:CDP-2,3-bis-(O-geranylgeranyl)-sn-glycerol synthase
MTVATLLLTALWVMLPAYVPNSAAVLGGGGPPIDGGRTYKGRRLLGDGKTWRGTAVGIAVGVLVARLLNWLQPAASELLGVSLPIFPVWVMVSLPTGAMLGDIIASFLKRRTGRDRGATVPLLDQLDFVVVALGLTVVVAPEWVLPMLSATLVAIVVVLTPLFHLGTNVIAYRLGLKNEPW